MFDLKPVVIDTNILLDCFVFEDAAFEQLHQQIVQAQLGWLATLAMKQEFLRTLSYPSIQRRTQTFHAQKIQYLKKVFDKHAHIVQPPLVVTKKVLCKDRDDQIFIDLAIARHAVLLSKDKEVLKLRPQLSLLGVKVSNAQQAALV